MIHIYDGRIFAFPECEDLMLADWSARLGETAGGHDERQLARAELARREALS